MKTSGERSQSLTLPPALRADVSDALGYYVYGLVDPRNEQIFYVGKGKGSRFLSHEREAVQGDGTSAKHERIRQILAEGVRPRVDVIRHGLPDDAAAFLVEAAVIDALSPGLTNAVRGRGDGRLPLDELKVRYAAPELTSDVPPAVLVRLSRWRNAPEEIEPGHFRAGNGWRPDMTSTELADSVRAWWKINVRSVERRRIKHAVAVVQGVTRGVFEIGTWLTPRADGRRAFAATPIVEGPLFDAYVGQIGKRVTAAKGSQNPITYWPA
jgi:hypothetical protein